MQTTEQQPVSVDPTPLFQRAAEVMNDLRNAVPDYERITDDEQGLLAAFSVAFKADCTRRRVGCVVVDVHGRVIGTGRNGAPSGQPGCLSAGACPRGQLSYAQVAGGSSYSGAGACIALHGEVNGIAYTDPMARRGGTIFVTDSPCDDCARHLAGSGLARIVWPERSEDGVWRPTSFDIIRGGRIGGFYEPREPHPSALKNQ